MAWVPTLPLLLGTEGSTAAASRSPALHTHGIFMGNIGTEGGIFTWNRQEFSLMRGIWDARWRDYVKWLLDNVITGHVSPLNYDHLSRHWPYFGYQKGRVACLCLSAVNWGCLWRWGTRGAHLCWSACYYEEYSWKIVCKLISINISPVADIIATEMLHVWLLIKHPWMLPLLVS